MGIVIPVAAGAGLILAVVLLAARESRRRERVRLMIACARIRAQEDELPDEDSAVLRVIRDVREMTE